QDLPKTYRLPSIQYGFGGNDTLYAGPGSDRLYGHSGADIFFWDGATDGIPYWELNNYDFIYGGTEPLAFVNGEYILKDELVISNSSLVAQGHYTIENLGGRHGRLFI